MIYGDYFEELARPILRDKVILIVRIHNGKSSEDFFNEKHQPGTNTAGCVWCEEMMRVLMLLQGMEYKK